MFPDPLSGSKIVIKFTQLLLTTISAFMNAAGEAAAAPWEITAPVADVSCRPAAAAPVANAMVETGPVMPDVIVKPSEIES